MKTDPSTEAFEKAYAEQYGSNSPTIVQQQTESDKIGEELNNKVQSQNAESDSDTLGALKVGAESAGNQLAFGLPEIAYEHLAAPSDVADYEAQKRAHPVANLVGGGIGALGSLAIGGPLFEGAAKAGQLVEGAVLGGRALEDTSIARPLASKMLGGAAEGAVIGSPTTIAQTALGDPKAAAENLMFSAGLGGLLGPAKFGLSKAFEGGSEIASNALSATDDKLSSFIKEPSPQLSLFGETNKSGLAGSEITDAGRSSIQNLLGGVIKKSAKLAGLATGGPLGYLKGEAVGELAKQAVNMIPDQYLTAGLQATLKATQLANKQISRIPDILNNLSESGFGKAVGVSGSIMGEAGKDIAKSADDYEAFEKFSKKLTDNQVNGKTQDIIGNNSAALSHNPILQSAYQMASLNAINYLQSVMPKNPNPVKLFSTYKWQPTQAQLNQFKSRLDIVHNPYIVLDKLNDGTITGSDVDTLQHVYPSIYTNITNSILKHGTDPKYENLSFAAKNKLSTLTGVAIDSSWDPVSINALQANFTKQSANSPDSGVSDNTGGSKKALSNFPSLSTENQNISMGQPGENS